MCLSASHTVTKATIHRPQLAKTTFAATRPISRKALVCRAQDGSEQPSAPKAPEANKASEPPATPREPEAFIKGQGTALVTGFISLMCGAGYLYLVSFFDQRNAGMLPPPPEAFGL